jgi:hypothetical protein
VKFACSFRRLAVNNHRCTYRHPYLRRTGTSLGRPTLGSLRALLGLPFARMRSANPRAPYLACWCGIRQVGAPDSLPRLCLVAADRAGCSCDQPIIPAERVEQQLADFLTGFAPNQATQTEILRRLSSPAAKEDSQTTKRRAALEERLRRMRDLYELGDLHRAE